MMRKITFYSLLCILWLGFSSCKDDEASAPPKPSFTVDKTTGLAFDEEFTFTIDEVDADAIVLLPEGKDSNTTGIAISSFTEGKAVVTYKYSHVGTYSAVVVASNWSDNGESVKRTYSETVSISLASDNSSLISVSIGDYDGELQDEVDTDIDTFNITLPYDPYGKVVNPLSALVTSFTASPYATVEVGSVTQTSGTTPNNFTSGPVIYTVTSEDGTESTDFAVKVTITPISTDNTVKSSSGKVVSKADEGDPYKSGDAFASYVDNTTHLIAVVLPYNFPADVLDSIRLSITANSEFAGIKYGGEKYKQDTLLNLTSSKTVKVTAQDGSEQDYKVIAVIAPKLTLSFQTLIPAVAGTTEGFSVNLKVLNGTNKSALPTTSSTTGGGTVNSIMVTEDGGSAQSFTSGNTLDFSGDVEFELDVTDGADTYRVVYTASITVLP